MDMEAAMKRIPPHSAEAEQAVLGAMLMNKEAISMASEIITGEDFYQTAYGILFDCIVEMFQQGKPVDLITLQDYLKEKDVPPEISNMEFARDLLMQAQTSANADTYAKIVREKSVMRRLIKVNEETANTCYQQNKPLDEILEDAQKKVFDVLLAVIHKPGKVIIECPYTIMGYVWSLHKKAIPVIELQHGVLNDKHYAYNSLYTSPILYPDEICVFGEDEYQFLTGDDSHYCKKVYKTGLYFMELAQKSFTNDIFREYRVKYEHIILVAGQRGYEEAMADYIREAAKKTPKCLYVYVPRDIDAELVFDQENVIYRPGINIYEYMIWCDVHLTISSTTCLECQYYKKPTIFYNYAEMSENYYGKVLKAENGVVFTKSVSEYEQALEKVLTTKFDYKEVFTGNTVKRIKEIINK